MRFDCGQRHPGHVHGLRSVMAALAEAAKYCRGATVRGSPLHLTYRVRELVERAPAFGDLAAAKPQSPQLNAARRADHRRGCFPQAANCATLCGVRPILCRPGHMRASCGFPVQRKPAEQRQRPCSLRFRPTTAPGPRAFHRTNGNKGRRVYLHTLDADDETRTCCFEGARAATGRCRRSGARLKYMHRNGRQDGCDRRFSTRSRTLCADV